MTPPLILLKLIPFGSQRLPRSISVSCPHQESEINHHHFLLTSFLFSCHPPPATPPTSSPSTPGRSCPLSASSAPPVMADCPQGFNCSPSALCPQVIVILTITTIMILMAGLLCLLLEELPTLPRAPWCLLPPLSSSRSQLWLNELYSVQPPHVYNNHH